MGLIYLKICLLYFLYSDIKMNRGVVFMSSSRGSDPSNLDQNQESNIPREANQVKSIFELPAVQDSLAEAYENERVFLKNADRFAELGEYVLSNPALGEQITDEQKRLLEHQINLAKGFRAKSPLRDSPYIKSEHNVSFKNEPELAQEAFAALSVFNSPAFSDYYKEIQNYMQFYEIYEKIFHGNIFSKPPFSNDHEFNLKREAPQIPPLNPPAASADNEQASVKKAKESYRAELQRLAITPAQRTSRYIMPFETLKQVLEKKTKEKAFANEENQKNSQDINTIFNFVVTVQAGANAKRQRTTMAETNAYLFINQLNENFVEKSKTNHDPATIAHAKITTKIKSELDEMKNFRVSELNNTDSSKADLSETKKLYLRIEHSFNKNQTKHVLESLKEILEQEATLQSLVETEDKLKALNGLIPTENKKNYPDILHDMRKAQDDLLAEIMQNKSAFVASYAKILEELLIKEKKWEAFKNKGNISSADTYQQLLQKSPEFQSKLKKMDATQVDLKKLDKELIALREKIIFNHAELKSDPKEMVDLFFEHLKNNMKEKIAALEFRPGESKIVEKLQAKIKEIESLQANGDLGSRQKMKDLQLAIRNDPLIPKEIRRDFNHGYRKMVAVFKQHRQLADKEYKLAHKELSQVVKAKADVSQVSDKVTKCKKILEHRTHELMKDESLSSSKHSKKLVKFNNAAEILEMHKMDLKNIKMNDAKGLKAKMLAFMFGDLPKDFKTFLKNANVLKNIDAHIQKLGQSASLNAAAAFFHPAKAPTVSNTNPEPAKNFKNKI